MNSAKASSYASLFSIVFFSLFVTACGNSKGDSYEQDLILEKKSRCEEINQVVSYLLQHHLTKSEADRTELYHETIEELVMNLSEVLDTYGYGYEFTQYMESQKENGKFNSTELKDCQHLESIQNFLELRGLAYQFENALYWQFLTLFTSKLDHYSFYQIPPAAIEGSNDKYYTFGLRLDLDLAQNFNHVETDAKVLAVMDPESPLKPGDRITHIDLSSLDFLKNKLPYYHEYSGYSVTDLTSNRLAGTISQLLLKFFEPSLNISYRPKDAPDEIRQVKLKGWPLNKASNDLPLVQAELKGDIIYVRLFQFGEGATAELLNKIHLLKQEWLISKTSNATSQNSVEEEISTDESMKSASSEHNLSIILDLRFNPGGYIREMESLIGLFLPRGKIGRLQLRDTTTKRLSYIIRDVHSESVGPIFTEPLIVLANNRSASAADITIQALTDTGRAYFVGMPTFGKGIQQVTINLGLLSKLGGSITYTNGRYYGLKGDSVQIKGKQPDLKVEDPFIEKLIQECKSDPNKECSRQFMKDLPSEEQIPAHSLDPLKDAVQSPIKTRFTDNQSQTARNLANKMTALDGERLDIQRQVAEELLKSLSAAPIAE